MEAYLRFKTLTLSLLTVLLSFQAHADELSQGELRSRFYNLAQQDLAANLKAAGLQKLLGPLSPIENKFKSEIKLHADVKLSRLETKLLVRYPQHIPRVKIVKDLAYQMSNKLCDGIDAQGNDQTEGNEVDSARHFIAAFSLALLAGEKFAYKYLTAHESWLLDEQLDQFTGYNFASTVMDLHNNRMGLEAAREYQRSFSLFSLTVEVHAFTKAQLRRMALQALKKARQKNLLVAVYTKELRCSQASQRFKFYKLVGLPVEQPIL